ncbi:MAG: four helix bundle protein [Flavobacteriaceae bacterium]|nr:four helix bundle protein [Flavobacteriaceae bacterium]
MEQSKSFEDVPVWQKAHQFVLSIYEKTKFCPKEELCGLTSQFRRASASIGANISEGYKKNSTRDKLWFFNIVQGVLEEYSYYFILTEDLNYVEDIKSQNESLIEVSKLSKAYSRFLLNSLNS